MAAPGKPSGSRWGSFLSQAVAGVESRLDNMLGDLDDGQQAQQAQPAAAKPPQPAPSKQSPATSRSSSNTRTNDRLQARLAKAVAAKHAQGVAPSPLSSGDASRRNSADQPSTEREQADEKDVQPEPIPVGDATEPSEPSALAGQAASADDKELPITGQTASQEAVPDTEAPEQAVASEPSQTAAESDKRDIVLATTEQKETMVQLSRDMEDIKVRQQEEIQEYVERIDSLQAKLQYLSKNAAESAKKAATSATSGSAERRLAEKDEKIALLMEEGQKLSNSEQKFRTSIKRLRVQMAETEKQTDELKQGKTKALAEAEALRSRLNGDQEKEKRQEEARKATTSLQKEIDSLRRDRVTKLDTIRRLEEEAKARAEQAETAHTAAVDRAVAVERRKQKELEDMISSLQAEKEAQSQKTRQENTEWREKVDRAVERGHNMENELRVEIRAMEAKLEAMRSIAEEASSGSAGEAQVKLLRQIETLQSQYASASDNWQGIEASLIAKAAGLEKERDEAQRRESEMRKKARDAASRSKRLEEELEDLQPAHATAQEELEAARERLASLRMSSKATETALEQARTDLEKQKRVTSREDPAEAERRQWVDEVTGASRIQSRPDSPLLSVQRTFSSDLLAASLQGRKRGPTPGSIPDSSLEGLGLSSLGRRLSSQPPPRTSSITGSGTSPSPLMPFEPPSEPADATPSVTERDDGMDDVMSSSPRNVAQDMVSASTVAAGPSVQLVERMSAAIRRLEGEKVAAKEEMARVQSQRDEARSDMVGLMKELETAGASTTRVSELEKEVSSLNARYQTTLEMLGEKSERVEELQADVEDVKAMYRELVERTVK